MYPQLQGVRNLEDSSTEAPIEMSEGKRRIPASEVIVKKTSDKVIEQEVPRKKSSEQKMRKKTSEQKMRKKTSEQKIRKKTSKKEMPATLGDRDLSKASMSVSECTPSGETLSGSMATDGESGFVAPPSTPTNQQQFVLKNVGVGSAFTNKVVDSTEKPSVPSKQGECSQPSPS